jgi:hypothetical protein
MDIANKDLNKTFSKLEVDEVDCAHHRRGFVCDEDGRPILPIYCSRGRKGLQGRPAHQFIKDLNLSEPEFRLLVECTLSRTEYLALLALRLP